MDVVLLVVGTTIGFSAGLIRLRNNIQIMPHSLLNAFFAYSTYFVSEIVFLGYSWPSIPYSFERIVFNSEQYGDSDYFHIREDEVPNNF